MTQGVCVERRLNEAETEPIVCQGLMKEHMAAMDAATYDRTWVEIDALERRLNEAEPEPICGP